MAKVIVDYSLAVDRNSPEGKAIRRQLAEILKQVERSENK